MKAFLLIISILLSTNYFAQTDYYQYFDGADTIPSQSILIDIDTTLGNNIWQIGPPQKIIFNSASTLPNVIVTDTINNYPEDDTSSFRIRMYNQWFNWGVLAVQWMQKLDLDSLNDGGLVEFSIDGGLSWQNAFNNPYVYNFYGFNPANQGLVMNTAEGFVGSDSTWKNVWLCFDLSWISQIPDTLHFKFTFLSDSIASNNEGWMIDNMMAMITNIHTVEEIEPSDYLTVSPNPTSDKIFIVTKKIDEFHIIKHMELFNDKGQIVQKFGASSTKFNIDIGHHPDGNYILKVTTNQKVVKKKIIIQH